MIECPICSAELADGLEVCPKCAAVVSQAPSAPVAAPKRPPEPAARCQRPGCGGSLPPGSTTCPYCGQPAAVPTPAGGSHQTGRLVFPWGEQDVPADGPLRIGRETSPGEMAARLAQYPNVSRRHAELRWRDGRLVLTDLTSTNRTFVNGQPLPAERPHPVADGDTVRFAAHLAATVQIVGPA